MTENSGAAYVTHHLARIQGDGEQEWVETRCPHPADSPACGLVVENPRHDPDACAYYDEGEDGCSDTLAGWEPSRGCSVGEMLSQAGTTVEETFDTYDTSSLPRGEWFPVDVTWDGYGEEAVPTLAKAEAVDA